MTRKRKVEPPVNTELPITPMLDMTFQLMAFFIMTFRPVPLEGSVAFNLPAEKDPKATQNQPVDPNPDTIDPPANVSVVVRSAGGGIGALSIKEDVATTDVGNDVKVLQSKLAELRKKAGGDDPKLDSIKIEADSTLRYVFLVEVMDACIKAGYKNPGFASPPDLGPPKGQ